VFGHRWWHARFEFDTSGAEPPTRRVDTNYGHTHIDFGGQWVIARLAATGQFRHLYHRDAQWAVVREAYPLDRQSEVKQRYSFPAHTRPTNWTADDAKTDADYLMGCLMGDGRDTDRANALTAPLGIALAGMNGSPLTAATCQIEASERFSPDLQDRFRQPLLGGPLYPPVHALLYAPLGTIADPQRAYFVFQWVSFGACFLAGWCVRVISQARIWWPVAVTLILIYPGGRPGLDLGQNHYLTLAIVLGGWALALRVSEFAGGAVWGLLAFKPVWGLAFILMPVLMRRWRFVAGTGACGMSLVLSTLPLVGISGWKDWLAIGSEASARYNVTENWVNLSRDVSGIPRRFLLDFSQSEKERETGEAKVASFACLGAVLVGTVAVYLGRGNRRYGTGLSAAFLAFGAYLSCYRFMYYDAVLSLLGYSLLLANPAWLMKTPVADWNPPTSPPWYRRVRLYGASFPLTVLALMIVNDNVLVGANPKATFALGRWATVTTDSAGKETLTPKLTVASDWNHPIDTFLVIAVWAWCGWRLLRDGRVADEESVQPRSSSSAVPMSGDRMRDSPTSTA
jgi:hypothetical protein